MIAVRKLHLITAASVLLVCWLGHFRSLVSADQALSEFWSEADGLQLKYSTNHDDLLGATKGSELSLATTKSEQRAEEPEGGVAEQRNGASSSSGSGSDGDNNDVSSNGGETATEGDSASSTGESESAGNERQQQQNEFAPNDEQGDDSREKPAVIKPNSIQQSQQVHERGSQKWNANSNNNNNNNNADSDEGSAGPAEEAGVAPVGKADESDADEEKRGGVAEPEVMSFNSALEQAEEADERANVDNGDNLDDNRSEVRPLPAGRPRQVGRGFKSALRMAVDVEADGGDTFGSSGEESHREGAGRGHGASMAAASQRARTNMVDFDRLAEAKRRQSLAASTGAQRGDGFYEARDEFAAGSERSGGQPAVRAKAGPSRALATDARQLSYFRTVSKTAADSRQADSPDSVRDNFISPGHFPGSMPHLTQAASEVSPSPTVDQENNNNNNNNNKLVTSDSLVDKAVVPVAVGGLSFDMLVTPPPASQAEAQQIMAPLLGPTSTTTVAPDFGSPSTTTPFPTTTTTTTTSTSTTSAPSSSTTSTSQAPALKRFKFRKYR